MSVQKITKDNYASLVKNSEKTVLLDFYADWCGPCRMLAPAIEEIAAEHPEIVVGKVNVDEEGALAQRFGIVSIPFVALMKNGQLVGKALGYRPKAALLDELGL
jgi:thioredoxin 1